MTDKQAENFGLVLIAFFTAPLWIVGGAILMIGWVFKRAKQLMED